jgi:predicted nucleic acid-binding protein
MIVLDTDHASELGYRSVAGLRLLARLGESGEETVITAVTVEEQLRGRLAEIRRRHDPHDQIVAYERLVRQVELHASWTILSWDTDELGVRARERIPAKVAGIHRCLGRGLHRLVPEI